MSRVAQTRLDGRSSPRYESQNRAVDGTCRISDTVLLPRVLALSDTRSPPYRNFLSRCAPLSRGLFLLEKLVCDGDCTACGSQARQAMEISDLWLEDRLPFRSLPLEHEQRPITRPRPFLGGNDASPVVPSSWLKYSS